MNPDGVVRDSGIFARGWGADRASVDGVAESELGQMTGLLVPVDVGVAAAFLR